VQLAEGCELDTSASLGDAPRDADVAQRTPSAFEDGLDHRRVVERRIGVRHTDDRRTSTQCGSARAALDILGVFTSRLAEVHVEIDEAGRDDAPFGVEDRGARSRFERGRDLDDDTVRDADVGATLAGLVEQPSSAYQHTGLRQADLRSRAATTARPCATRPRSRPAR
jgi:hypothetical protein